MVSVMLGWFGAFVEEVKSCCLSRDRSRKCVTPQMLSVKKTNVDIQM